MDQSVHFIRRNWRTVLIICSQAIDMLVIAGSFALAVSVVHPDYSLMMVFWSHGKLIGFSIVVILTLFTALGIYRTISYAPLSWQLFTAGRGLTIAAALIFSVLFITRNLFYTRGAVILFLLFFVVAYGLVWMAGRRILAALRKAGYGRWKTLLISSGQVLRSQLDRLRMNPQLGYEVVRVMKFSNRADRFGRHMVNISEIEKAIRVAGVEAIIFTSPEVDGAFERLEELCRARRIRMLLLSSESDRLFRETRIHDLPGIPLFTPARRRIDFLKRSAKRAFDILGSSVLLLVFSPVFLLVAVATKIESRGPVFYRQRRSLCDTDKPFKFYKFRSMHLDADEMKDGLSRQNISDGALFKIKDDPRRTRVGRLIRRLSIDELPQLINVLKGEMSLVGPRPLPIGDFKRLQRRDHMGGYFRHRAGAKPGMTGLWQISGRSDLGFREMILLDLYYVDNQTILFDLEIMAQTIPVVVLGKGAY